MDNPRDIRDIENELKNLGSRVRKHCTKCNLRRIGTFTFMFNEAEGQNICYVKDMEMAEMGWTMNFYNKKSQHYRPDHDYIEWPYTGFVRGVAEEPISISLLAEWLKKSPYLETASPLRKNFITFFEELIQ